MFFNKGNIDWKIYRAFIQIVLIFAIGTFGFYILLDEITLLESLYLTVITLTTVGYGDISPVHNASPDERSAALTFSIILILFGMSAFVYAAGILTQYVTSGQMKRHRHILKMNKRISKLRNHFLIIGASETGCYIANELKAVKRPFVIIDSSQIALTDYAGEDKSICYIHADATDEKALLTAGLAYAKRIAITLPCPRDTLYLIITLKELAAKNDWNFEIIAKCPNEIYEKKFRLAGVNHIIKSNLNCSQQIINARFRPTTKTFLDRVHEDSSSTIRIDEAHIRSGSSLENKLLKESKIMEMTDLRICAIKNSISKEWIINPGGDHLLCAEDILIFVGDIKNAQKIRKMAENA